MRASVGQFFLTFRNWFLSLTEHLLCPYFCVSQACGVQPFTI